MESLPSFAELFGRPPSVRADAPGRVNLIGEHTDYNGGFVLPIVIPQRTRVALARARRPRGPCCGARNMPLARPVRYEFDIGNERPQRAWIDYVAGVTTGPGRSAATSCRGSTSGSSRTCPSAAGLSSSAALEISVAAALRARASTCALDDVELARIGQWAENEFVGAPTGIMDQMVVEPRRDRLGALPRHPQPGCTSTSSCRRRRAASSSTPACATATRPGEYASRARRSAKRRAGRSASRSCAT